MREDNRPASVLDTGHGDVLEYVASEQRSEIRHVIASGEIQVIRRLPRLQGSRSFVVGSHSDHRLAVVSRDDLEAVVHPRSP